MKESDRDLFNKKLREKFKDASFEPSSAVWDAIEANLLRDENKRIQKKAIWYRNIAAAVILIAFISIYFNLANRFSGEKIVSGFQTIELPSSAAIAFNNDEDKAGFPSIVNDVLLTNKSALAIGSINSLLVTKDNQNTDVALSIAASSKEENVNSGPKNVYNKRTTFYLTTQKNRAPQTEGFPSLINRDELEKVSFFAISELDKEKKSKSVNFQANVLFGSGNFNPNASISEGNSVLPTAILSNSSRVASRNDVEDGYNERQTIEDLSNAPMRSNLSLTYGLNFGLNVGKRVIIKSGLSYGNFRSTSESSAVLRDLNNNELFPYHGASSAASTAEGKVINITSPYNLYNDFEILSIPLQFSYKIIDSKFDVALMTGATADFLLSNALTGASDQLNTISFSQQKESAYRNVFASGIIGLEISYELGKHYGLSLSPQYKKALTDVTSSGVGFSSIPAFASVNMSFQYIF